MKTGIKALAIVAVMAMIGLPLMQNAAGAMDNWEINVNNNREIIIDGEQMEGLKGFTYKCMILVHSNSELLNNINDPQDVRGIDLPTPLIIDNWEIDGIIKAECGSPLEACLNGHYEAGTCFQITVTVMQDSYPEGLGLKQFTFDGAHVDDREFQLDSHGYALTTYTFTSDRLREA